MKTNQTELRNRMAMDPSRKWQGIERNEVEQSSQLGQYEG
jgi:hypothetical protein